MELKALLALCHARGIEGRNLHDAKVNFFSRESVVGPVFLFYLADKSYKETALPFF